jgi:hypothetical protein
VPPCPRSAVCEGRATDPVGTTPAIPQGMARVAGAFVKGDASLFFPSAAVDSMVCVWRGMGGDDAVFPPTLQTTHMLVPRCEV